MATATAAATPEVRLSRVGKRAVQNTEQVSDNVRHEELRVDKSGDVNVDSDVSRTGKRKKPAA